jgi:hypothetical protein
MPRTPAAHPRASHSTNFTREVKVSADNAHRRLGKTSTWVSAICALFVFCVLADLAVGFVNTRTGIKSSVAAARTTDLTAAAPRIKPVTLGQIFDQAGLPVTSRMNVLIGSYNTQTDYFELILPIRGTGYPLAVPRDTVTESGSETTSTLFTDTSVVVQWRYRPWVCTPTPWYWALSYTPKCVQQTEQFTSDSVVVDSSGNVQSGAASSTGLPITNPDVLIKLLSMGNYHITVPSGTLATLPSSPVAAGAAPTR